MEKLRNLPERLDDGMIEQLELVATAPIPEPEPFDPAHFDKCITIMLTALKRKNADDVSAKLLIETYRRMLGHLPKGAIAYISEQSIAHEDWFPTVKQCLAYAGQWVPPTREMGTIKQIAANRVRAEKTQRFDETMKALAKRSLSQERIDALPLSWKRIAAEKCYLRDLGEGRFEVRPDIDAGRFMPPAQAQAEFTDFTPNLAANRAANSYRKAQA